MIITVPKNFLWEKIIQFCPHCDTQTVHALSKSGEFYACGCGHTLTVEIKEDE